MNNPLFISEASSNYQVIRELGHGGEGRVYLVRDRSTNEKFVMKIFYRPMRGPLIEGIRRYAARVDRNSYGLPKSRLIQTKDQIEAVLYPYMPLYMLHWRLRIIFEPLPQALFGTYCRMQTFLLSQHQVALVDTIADNFMLSRSGRFHYIDLGRGISPIHYDKYVDRGEFGYSFAMLLLSLYNVNIKMGNLPRPGYSYGRPCVYCMDKRLDIIAHRHQWVQEILLEVRSRKASVFLEPRFYQELGKRFSTMVPFPFLIFLASQSLSTVKKFRELRRF